MSSKPWAAGYLAPATESVSVSASLATPAASAQWVQGEGSAPDVARPHQNVPPVRGAALGAAETVFELPVRSNGTMAVYPVVLEPGGP
jgi:hypothetical protein